MDNAQVPIEQLDVAVAGGAVTLRGAARDDRTRRRAEELAAMIAGVKSVRNELHTE
jgi:osmotically-inducible protein OsmY